MRCSYAVLLTCVRFFLVSPALSVAQNSDLQPLALPAQSIVTLPGGTAVVDVTLTSNAATNFAKTREVTNAN
jgi:hypothetical protein